MKNRRYFLKTACKPIVLATLGIPIIEACSTEEDSTVQLQLIRHQQIIRRLKLAQVANLKLI